MDALMQQQVELEIKYNKNQVITRIKKEFASAGFEEAIVETGVPVQFGMDLLAQMALHKRCKIDTMVGVLIHHFDDPQITADMIMLACQKDLVDWSVPLRQLIVRFNITDDVQLEIDKYQFPLPMVVEPKEVRTNKDTGMLMSSGSILLKKNHHDEDVCLDHINRMNKVRFKLNHDVATFVKNEWSDLDKPKQGETKQDYERRVRAFEKYDRVAHDVIAEIETHGSEFYMTHKYDKRGRIYCQGYHISYQGNPWNKACIELATEELVQ